MVGKQGWFESLHTAFRVPSTTSDVRCDSVQGGSESNEVPTYNEALVFTIKSVQHALPSGFKCLQVHTLLKETITLAVHTKCRVRDVYLCCCSYLKMKESWLLGLASRVPSEGFGSDRPRHEYYFLDSNCKIAKYGLKHWRLNSLWTSYSESRPFLVLHLRVRIYVSDAHIIKCPIVLNYYYLQLRENLLDQWSTPESISEERCWKMASVAYETDSIKNGGSENCDATRASSFRPERYFPLWVINAHGLDYVRRNLRNIESGQQSRSREEAILEFCEQACSSPFALNCHLYGLRQYKVDTVDNAFIGITPNGIEMSDIGDDGGRNLRKTLQWSEIVLLSFDKRKVRMLGSNGSCTSLYAHSEEKARYLFEFCRTVHQAVIRINQCLYACRDQLENVKESLLLSPEAVPTELLLLRQSPVSRVSSNSTSGVVSDKPSSEADREFDWTVCGSVAEIQTSSNVSPKSLAEGEEDSQEKIAENQSSKTENSSSDVASGVNMIDEKTFIEPLEINVENSCPKQLTVDTSIGKMLNSLEDATVAMVSPSLDSASEKIFPKPPVIDTSVGRYQPEPQSSASLVEKQLLAMHLNQMANYETPSELLPGSSRTLIPDGEIIEDDVNLGVPISLIGFPQGMDCRCLDSAESPIKSAVEVSEIHCETTDIGRRLRPSNSVNIGSLYKLSEKCGEDACTACHARAEALREQSSCDIGLKMPPLYAEAVALTKGMTTNARKPSDTKAHVKQRRKTVAGFAAPADSSSTSQYQQFQYSQAQAQSEPKLDLQLLSRSASPPPALHLSMQQLPVIPPQQISTYSAGMPGKFQKQSRLGTRFPCPQNSGSINRVQSMPAHPAPLIHIYDVGNNETPAMLHHAHSLAVRPLSAENKEPPSYEHAVQQARARYTQQNAASTAKRSTEQSSGTSKGSFPSASGSKDPSLKNFPFMTLLLQEHQQENMELLNQSGATRSQTTTVSGSHQTSPFVGDVVSVVSDDRSSESPTGEIRDIRTARPTFLPLSGRSSHNYLHSDLFDATIFGENTTPFLQQSDIYCGGFHPEHSLMYRQYAPYIAEQQAANARQCWNPIPPPPPYPQSRSSASALEAPMVM